MSATKEVAFIIDQNGGLEFVYDDEAAEALKGEGFCVTARASHVEPTPDGRWSVDVSPILGSPEPVVIGTYPSRALALEAEVAWVIRHLTTR